MDRNIDVHTTNSKRKGVESIDNTDILGERKGSGVESGSDGSGRLEVSYTERGRNTDWRLRENTPTKKTRADGYEQTSKASDKRDGAEVAANGGRGGTFIHHANVVVRQQARVYGTVAPGVGPGVWTKRQSDVHRREASKADRTTASGAHVCLEGAGRVDSGMGESKQTILKRNRKISTAGSENDRRGALAAIIPSGSGNTPINKGGIPRHDTKIHGTYDGKVVQNLPIVRMGRATDERGSEGGKNPINIMGKWKRWKRLNRFLPKGERVILPTEHVKVISGGAKVWKEQEYEKEWPLHAPMINLINDEAFSRAKSWLNNKELNSFGYLKEEQKYLECEEKRNMLDIAVSRFEKGDVETLQRNELFECTTGKGSGYVFSVGEKTKRRRRLVHDALLPNAVLPDPPNPGFKSIPEVKSMMKTRKFATAIDFKCYFYQFGLGKEVRKFFKVATKNETLQPKRLPMGFKWAVNIAQNMTKAITLEALGTLEGVDIYIDNVLITGETEKEVQQKQDRFVEVCNKWNVTIGSIEKGKVVEHRGMQLNFEEKKVKLKAAFVEKFKERCKKLNMEWGKIRSLLGMVSYAFMVYGLPFGLLYNVFKVWARNVESDLHKVITMPKEAREEWHRAVILVLNNSPIKVQDQEREAIIITDAALDKRRAGLGAILITKGEIKEFSIKVRNQSPLIAKYELMAIRYAQRMWKTKLKRTKLTVI
jgi:hypothetical protein